MYCSEPRLSRSPVSKASNELQGQLSGVFEWEKQDGFWFIKHGKRLSKGRIVDEWYIDEISFDAKKCRTRFDGLESTIPFATQITVYDGNKERVDERFKGGKAGEEVYKLIRLGLLKRRNSGD